MFFSCSAITCNFLSFPTRRSSDLLRRFDALKAAARSVDLDPVGAGGDARLGLLAHHVRVGAAAARGDPLAGDEHARDRKSTRLNSSHRTISYAVFCLKKKKHL